MTCHSSYHYTIKVAKLRFSVSYDVKYHSSGWHIIPFMTSIDKINTRTEETIQTLMKALPGLFGPHARKIL